MCGLVGIVQYKSKIPKDVRAKALRVLFSELMLRTEIRGDDATGVYQVQQDGEWMLAKKGQKVSNWLFTQREEDGDPVVYRDFMEMWTEHPQELSAIVGHCRKATVGSRGEDNKDNHPFAVQLDPKHAILGVHNGTLTNHEIIFKKLEEMGGHLTRQGTVDSESIFHLLYYATEHGTKPVTPEVMKYLGERIEGAYATISVNTRFPHQIVATRFERPLELWMIRPLNVVVICSEKKFMESALERYAFTREFLDLSLPMLDYVDRILAERDFRVLDTTLPFPENGKLEWNSFEAVSFGGEMRKVGMLAIDPAWRTTAEAYSGSRNSGSSIYSGYSAYTPASTTNLVGSPETEGNNAKKDGVIHLTAGSSVTPKKEEVSDAVIVDIEVYKDENVGKALLQAKSLGLNVRYGSPKEVADIIGKTPLEIDSMGVEDLANLLADYHFNLGYALAHVDSKNEVDEVRKKGREQLSKMEKLTEKQKRAEKRIWELKQVLLLALSLAEGNYPISETNIKIVLDGHFSPLAEERRKDILFTAKSILEDQRNIKLLSELQKRFREAEKNKKSRVSGK